MLDALRDCTLDCTLNYTVRIKGANRPLRLKACDTVPVANPFSETKTVPFNTDLISFSL